MKIRSVGRQGPKRIGNSSAAAELGTLHFLLLPRPNHRRITVANRNAERGPPCMTARWFVFARLTAALGPRGCLRALRSLRDGCGVDRQVEDERETKPLGDWFGVSERILGASCIASTVGVGTRLVPLAKLVPETRGGGRRRGAWRNMRTTTQAGRQA